MNFTNPSDWVLLINQRRQALRVNGRLKAIQAIEPDVQFRYPIVACYISSINSPRNWYVAGELLQIALTSFSGFAEIETKRVILNRYQIFQFNHVSYDKNNLRYLLSFVPKTYIPDITIRVWEYRGVQPETLEGLSSQISTASQSNKASINELKNKIDKLNELVGG